LLAQFLVQEGAGRFPSAFRSHGGDAEDIGNLLVSHAGEIAHFNDSMRPFINAFQKLQRGLQRLGVAAL
jgi:hypothetical protein